MDSVEALRTQQIARFKQSIADGVDPGMTDLAGETALHALVRAKHASALIFWLVQAGADVHHASFTDATPLLHAVRAGDERLVDVLLACGADPTACDWLGFCPARLAAYEQQVGCFRAITEHLVVKRRAEAAQEATEGRARPTSARRRPPRRRARLEAPAMTPEEVARRAAAAEEAASALLEEEAASKLKAQRAAERRQRRAKHKRDRATSERPMTPGRRLSGDEADAESEGEEGVREPAWLADLLVEEFEVSDVASQRRTFVEQHVRAAAALSVQLAAVQRCVACLDSGRGAMLVPCHHAVLCKSCAERIVAESQRCPVCAGAVAAWTPVFL